jgi:hypothetical protein
VRRLVSVGFSSSNRQPDLCSRFIGRRPFSKKTGRSCFSPIENGRLHEVARHLDLFTCNTTMTVRVDTLDALISGSSSRAIPFVRSLSAALLDRLASWRQQRSTLVMSDEWLQEYRWFNRDQH